MTLHDKMELAKFLGSKQENQLQFITATATSDSENGLVNVKFDDSDDEYEAATIAPVNEEDTEIQGFIQDGEFVSIGAAGWGDRVQTSVTNAESAAQQAQELAESVTAHFWEDSNGAHVTSYPKEDDATATGFESLISAASGTAGMLIRQVISGAKKLLASFTQGGVAFYDGGDNPVTLGVFSADGLRVYSNDEDHTEIAHLGYMPDSWEMPAPYYNLGQRKEVTASDPIGGYSLVTGEDNVAASLSSIASGSGTRATAWNSHSEGESTQARANNSHSEGRNTIAGGSESHAEGSSTVAGGAHSHAEGESTQATGEATHSEGYSTIASGTYSHAEGWSAQSSGLYSHAEGVSTNAQGTGAHSEGDHTKASSDYQHTAGQYNVEDTTDTYARITGNGTAATRSNAEALDWDGNLRLMGGVYVACEADSTGGRNLANVGMYYQSNPSGSYSLANNSTTQVGASVTVPAGRYMLTYAFDFASNATGRRYADIYNTTDSSVVQRSVQRMAPVNGAATSINGCIFVAPTQETTYSIRAYQNSGSALNISNRSIYAVRLR